MPDLNRFRLLWGRLRQTLWWRPAVWSAAAVAAAVASAAADAWVPAEWLPPLPSGVVNELLNIMASSMLVVSTFALSVLASAYASAASAGTPRATRLVVADPQSQKSVAVFLAAFIFSVVGLIAMGTGEYGAAGRMSLFICALGVLSWVIVSFMSYIDVLSRIGRVSHTIETVERAAAKSLHHFMRQPLGGAREASQPPAGARQVLCLKTGHVQFIDVSALQDLAQAFDGQVHLAVRPGDLVHPAQPLAWVLTGKKADPDSQEQAQHSSQDEGRDKLLRKAFVIGSERTFEQDAGFGFIVLTEIAQRAMSPAINDPGTAIAVLGSQTRLLIEALSTPSDTEAEVCDRVTARVTLPQSLVPIAYEAIARCSLDHFDVLLQWLRHVAALVDNAPPAVQATARDLVQSVLDRAVRAEVDAADLAGWQEAARAMGLTPGHSIVVDSDERV
jgi:uncharacterized membrane protein